MCISFSEYYLFRHGTRRLGLHCESENETIVTQAVARYMYTAKRHLSIPYMYLPLVLRLHMCSRSVARGLHMYTFTHEQTHTHTHTHTQTHTVGAIIGVGNGAAITGIGGEDNVGGGFTARPSNFEICTQTPIYTVYKNTTNH